MTARPDTPAKARASLAVAGGLPVADCPHCPRRFVPTAAGLIPHHQRGGGVGRCPGSEQPTGGPR